MRRPSRGQIWLVDFDPVVGHEQGRRRPAVVLSEDVLNHGPSGVITVVPVTSRKRNIPLHIPIPRGRFGLTKDSWVLCDQVRTISVKRLVKPYRAVDRAVMARIEEAVRIALGL